MLTFQCNAQTQSNTLFNGKTSTLTERWKRDSINQKGTFILTSYKPIFALLGNWTSNPDDLRALEIDITIDNLMSAHRGFNNFYNEPSFARQLQRIIGQPIKVPKSVEKKFIISIVETFLTNGNGVAVSANEIYTEILSNLDSHQANIAILAFTDTKISSRLQFGWPQRKFKELIEIVKPSITPPPVTDLVNYIENEYKGKPQFLMNDKTVKTSVDNLKTLLK